jgi:cell wall-associated NlpC family hydrolase
MELSAREPVHGRAVIREARQGAEAGGGMSRPVVAALAIAALLAITPSRAQATPVTGGLEYAAPPAAATVGQDGAAVARAGAPAAVVALIAAGNRIAKLPYRYGGGHAQLVDTGYDCSGSVSFALVGAGLLAAPLDSTAFMRWGRTGRGTWISVYANRGHAFLVVAGLRFDTSGATRAGSRWQSAPRATRGFRVRHPPGL